MKNAMQLKAIMKKLAKENQISAQLVLQNYIKKANRQVSFLFCKIICWNDSWSGYHYPRIGIITLSKVAF